MRMLGQGHNLFSKANQSRAQQSDSRKHQQKASQHKSTSSNDSVSKSQRAATASRQNNVAHLVEELVHKLTHLEENTGIQEAVIDFIVVVSKKSPSKVTESLSEVMHKLVQAKPETVEAVLRVVIDNIGHPAFQSDKDNTMLSNSFKVLRNVDESQITTVVEKFARMEPKEMQAVLQALTTAGDAKANELLSKIMQSESTRVNVTIGEKQGLTAAAAYYTNWRELYKHLNIDRSSDERALLFLLMLGKEYNDIQDKDLEKNTQGGLIHWLGNLDDYQKKREKAEKRRREMLRRQLAESRGDHEKSKQENKESDD